MNRRGLRRRGGRCAWGGPARPAHFVGRRVVLIGLILFGAATIRAGVFPRLAGLLLVAGEVLFGLSSFAGSSATIFEILGAAITCAALVWLGASLLSGSGATVGRPTHAS